MMEVVSPPAKGWRGPDSALKDIQQERSQFWNKYFEKVSK